MRKKFYYVIIYLFIIFGTNGLLLRNANFDSLENKNSNLNNTAKYQVFRMLPKNLNQLMVLNTLYMTSSEFQLDFWKAPTNINVYSDVMVIPEYLNKTKQFLNNNNIEFSIIIEDVEKLIKQRENSKLLFSSFPTKYENNSLLMSFFNKRMKDESFSTRNRAKYGFGDYHSYNDMIKWLNDIELYYPQIARVFTIGTTHEGRPIKGIKIGNPISDVSKRAIWIDGGMHAREWAAIHTALYFIEQLISLYGFDSKITSYVNNLQFYIVPVANPDGFEYSRSDITPQTRFWRKNRGMQICKKDRWRRERCCGGVDLNRNFDFHWGEIGSSKDLCSEIFQGGSAFSEPESRAIRDKILSPELNGRLDAFITLHTYSQMWIHPYNHERKSFPDDIDDLQKIGKKGIKAIENVYGTKFRFGTGADILYPSSGGSDDWAKAYGHIKYVYLLELRPGEEEWDGFLLDKRQLLPTGRETWEGVKVVIDTVLQKVQQKLQTTTFRTVEPTLPPQTSQAWLLQTQTTQSIIPRSRFILTTQNSPLQTRQLQPQLFSSPPQQLLRQRFDTTILNTNRNNNFNTNSNNIQLNRRTDQTVRKILRMRGENQSRLDLERQTQEKEQQNHILFWQNHQNRLHSRCSDRSPWCSNWIKAVPQICRTSTVYMHYDCQSTCGFCIQQQT